MTDTDTEAEHKGCAPWCDRVCNADYCRVEHETQSNMITGGRCNANRDGLEFDSTGLPLEKGDDLWVAVDARTGTRVGAASYFTREQVDAAITEWRNRDRRGKRQDIHDLMPHLEARRLAEATT